MKVVSLNVGLPRAIDWNGVSVRTGIFKDPVQGRLTLRKVNFDGDRQADLSVHGGVHKAVYAYPVEHYDYWRRELPGIELPFGMFGENLTTEGIFEADVHAGDRFRVGTAELVAAQPRLPCYKLGIKFRRPDMVKRFLASGRTGFYFSVASEGEVGAGDEIVLMDRDPGGIAIPDITRLFVTKRYSSADTEIARRAIQSEAIPESWRDYFVERLSEAEPSEPAQT